MASPLIEQPFAEPPPRCRLGHGIQQGLFISRCASHREMPMSGKVSSLNPSNSRRERARRRACVIVLKRIKNAPTVYLSGQS